MHINNMLYLALVYQFTADAVLTEFTVNFCPTNVHKIKLFFSNVIVILFNFFLCIIVVLQ